MREILFRGQTRRYGEKVRMGDGKKLPSQWVYGGIFAGTGDFSVIYGAKTEEFTGVAIEKHTVYSDTVGQYTGLKDKNGKRIFEGDIVEYNDGYDYFKGKVVFELGAFGIGNSEVCQAFIGNCDNFASLWDIYWEQEPIDAPELYYCTIIGNIHDNPELMEVR